MPNPPPPPPPGPPPAPAFNSANFKTSDNPEKGRGLLLESIRQGKTLKKTTVVNDRSAPSVDNSKARSTNSGSSANVNATVGNRGNGLNIPPGLGGLFAGGMPKLKSVGSPVKTANDGSSEQSSVPRNASSNSLNSNNNSSSPSSSTPASPSIGATKQPPPQPPPSNLKPSLNTSNPAPPPPPQVEERRTSVTNFGKPSVAPKPPAVVNGAKPARPNPPPKLYIPPSGSPSLNNSDQPSSATPSSAGVNRAQSMRVATKASSPTSANSASPEFRTMGRSAGRAFTTSSSPQPPPPPRIMNGAQRPRQTIRPPAARPPPPPQAKAPPGHPPPPPPANVPPPPPHRANPAPAPPQVRVNGIGSQSSNGPPPPPPIRNSSMRSITSNVSTTSLGSNTGSPNSSAYTGVDLEAKFGHLFHDLSELPKPDIYTGIVKHYPSKSAQSIKRQPAPQPPTQLQLENKLWVNNTSTC